MTRPSTISDRDDDRPRLINGPPAPGEAFVDRLRAYGAQARVSPISKATSSSGMKMHWIKRTLKIARIDPWYLIRGYPNGPRQSSHVMRRAHDYLESVGMLRLLRSGDSRELPPDLPDLAFLHRVVSERKPRCVLEFGCGFSTIVMAGALSDGELHSVDSSQEWIENTRAKLGAMPHVHLSFSPVKVGVFNGRL